jgi:endonuclease/exonuclease/phosphatase family metal-dependent hydrolase
MKKTLLYLVVFIVTLGMIGPGASAKWWHPHKEINVKVMTRNLYLGADIFHVFDAAINNPDDPTAIPLAVAQVYNTMLFTNFWARAEAIADEIEWENPDVIGLQEVSTYFIQTPGDFLAGNPVQAEDVVIDFYTVLNEALKARGLHYRAFTVTNADVELPMADPAAGPPFYLSDVRLVDHDVILVRRGIPAWEVLADNYDNNLEVELGGGSVEFTRGFVIVDTIIKGRIFRFVNTHLEVRDGVGSVFRLFQSWQMEELLETIDKLSEDGHSWKHIFKPKAVMMLGDFNSSSEDEEGESWYIDDNGFPILLPYTPPYMQAIDAGYLDAWLEQKFYDDGYTSGFDETISNPFDTLETRIDLIFLDPLDLKLKEVEADVVGDEIIDMVTNDHPLAQPPALLWPSDHAGVVAKIKFQKKYRPWWKRFRWHPK